MAVKEAGNRRRYGRADGSPVPLPATRPMCRRRLAAHAASRFRRTARQNKARGDDAVTPRHGPRGERPNKRIRRTEGKIVRGGGGGRQKAAAPHSSAGRSGGPLGGEWKKGSDSKQAKPGGATPLPPRDRDPTGSGGQSTVENPCEPPSDQEEEQGGRPSDRSVWRHGTRT